MHNKILGVPKKEQYLLLERMWRAQLELLVLQRERLGAWFLGLLQAVADTEQKTGHCLYEQTELRRRIAAYTRKLDDLISSISLLPHEQREHLIRTTIEGMEQELGDIVRTIKTNMDTLGREPEGRASTHTGG